MKKLQLKKVEFIKEITSKRNCLLTSQHGEYNFMQAIENADEKLDETIIGYINSMFFEWRGTEKVSNTKIVFNRNGEKSTLFLDENGEYYKVVGNYTIEYLVIVYECSGIKTTMIYGIEKA